MPNGWCNIYSVLLSEHADDFLSKLDSNFSARIKERLKRLSQSPVPSDAKFIMRDGGECVYRYRIGTFRALYKVKEQEKIVLITKIDKRPRIY